MHRFIRGAVFAAALGSVASYPLKAQRSTEATDAERRERCRFAAQILETGNPGPHRQWALGYIQLCEQSGGIALARAWAQSGDASESELIPLMASSIALRDQRIFAAVEGVARSTSASPLLRLAAMRVLSTYADTLSGVELSDLRASHDPGERVPVRSDIAMLWGTEPPAADAAMRAIAVFDDLAADGDPDVRAAAAYLAHGYASRK